MVLKPNTPAKEERNAQMFNNGNEWPVTQEMLNQALYTE
jgi:hypothetical protein